jgi:hypothetical protein
MFFLGQSAASRDLSSFHPAPVQIFRLWQTFLTNVNPLVKIFHAPTIQQVILDASGDVSKIPKPAEALMFSIYLLAVNSLQDDKCRALFQEEKALLLKKYSHAAQQALLNAKFLKSTNIYSLQAFQLFLVSTSDAHLPNVHLPRL